MIKRYVLVTMIIASLTVLCSCTLLVGPLDRNTSFSKQLTQREQAIRNENWGDAAERLQSAKYAWRRIKPWLQVDIDHDYVHEIEENLAKLEGYIDTEEKPEALATILMLYETWEDIVSL